MKETQWFVAVGDAASNEALAKYLADSGKEIFTENLLDEDGNEHQAYRVSYPTVNLVMGSQDKFGLKVVILNRYGQYGKVRRWKFTQQKKKKQARVTTAAKMTRAP